MEVLTQPVRKTSTCPRLPTRPPDLTTFARVGELGLEVVGQHLERNHALLACQVLEPDHWCRRCGGEVTVRDTVTKKPAHEPFGWRPTTLIVKVRRYRCNECQHVWRQDITRAANPRSKLSRRALPWALELRVVKHLTPIRNRTGPSRLLDMVESRSKQVFKNWLAARPQAWRQGIEVVAMDGFTGFKTAAAEELPQATAVMDPFHVVRLGGEALDRCRCRVQQLLLGHRGRCGDPLYGARRKLHTGAGLLTDRQRGRLENLFASDDHIEVQATWSVYQRMIEAYRQPVRMEGKELLTDLIAAVSKGVPVAFVEIRKLGVTLKRRAGDILAYFDRPGTSSAINGRLEYLRGSALGFRNLRNYIARSLLESGGFRPVLHSALGRALERFELLEVCPQI